MPPPIDSAEAKHGLYSLLQRGLIPPTAKISFDPEPIVSNTVALSDKDSHQYRHLDYSPQRINENVYKLDRSYETEVQRRINQKLAVQKSTDSNEKQNYLKKKTNSNVSNKGNFNSKTQVGQLPIENPLVSKFVNMINFNIIIL